MPPSPVQPAPASCSFQPYERRRIGETLREAMRRLELEIIDDTLRLHGGHVTRAAEVLGLSREALHRKLAARVASSS